MVVENQNQPLRERTFASLMIGVLLFLLSFLLGYAADVYFSGMINIAGDTRGNSIGQAITQTIFLYSQFFIPIIIGLSLLNNKAWKMLKEPQPKIDSMSFAKRTILLIIVCILFTILAIVSIFGSLYFKEITMHNRYIPEGVTYIIIMVMSFVVMFIYNAWKKRK